TASRSWRRAPLAPTPPPAPLRPRSTRTSPPAPRAESSGCRGVSYRARLPLLGDVLARAHRQRKNRPRHVLVGVGHERAAVGDEQVAAIVRLAIAVQHGRFRIVPH